MRSRVAIVGSGSWGTVIGKIVAENVARLADFEPVVRMWTFEEQLPDGRLLTRAINADHENPKYAAGLVLPRSLVAVADVAEATRGASHLIFVLPHQFLERTLRQIAAAGLRSGVQAISLIKGISFDPQKGPVLLSELIGGVLGGAECAVLMGANVASEVAEGQLCEATVGVRSGEGRDWLALFHQPTFRCRVVAGEIATIEMLGALKNVVALAAGFADGLGCGGNTKAALMRIGFGEMRRFIVAHGGRGDGEAYWESCGIADLITTCYGGRNRRVAEIFAKGRGKVAFPQVEKEAMNGQLLQGPGTLQEVVHVLRAKGVLAQYPLFAKLFSIMFEGRPVEDIVVFD